MRVHFWVGGIHPISESLLLDPPPGVALSSNVRGFQYDSYRGSGRNPTGVAGPRQLFDRLSYGLGVPRIIPLRTDADLIHTLSGVVPLTAKPWVTSIEMPSSFYGLRDEWARSNRRRSLLRFILSMDNCKRILCFSQATRHSLLEELGCAPSSTLGEKIDTIYPSVNVKRFKRGNVASDGVFKVLFIGNHFFDKGGRELFRAVSNVARDRKIRLTVVASAPPHHMHMFKNFLNAHRETWVDWHTTGVARKRLVEEYYPNANLFVMPSYIDLFGYVFLEAMASGLPIIGARVHAQNEIVDHCQNGYLVDAPITPFESGHGIRTAAAVRAYRLRILDETLFDGVVKELEGRILTLMDDERLRRRMGEKSIETVTSGRFGVDTRNQCLSEVYHKSIE